MDDIRRAEEALVASLVLAPRRVGDVSSWLRPSDFGSPACRLLYGRLLEVPAEPADSAPVRLLDALRSHGELRADGYPVSALAQWFDSAPHVAQVGAYGALVLEGSLARETVASGERLIQVSGGEGSPRALDVAASQRLVLRAQLRRWSSVPGEVRDLAGGVGTEPEPGADLPSPACQRTRSADVDHAELVSVGSLLVAPRLAARVRWLEPADFTSPDLAQVYRAMTSMIDAGVQPDRVTVGAQLHRSHVAVSRGDWDGVLRRAEASVPVADAVVYYARQVLDDSALQTVGRVGARLVELGHGRAGGASVMLRSAISQLDGLDATRGRVRSSRVSPQRDPARRAARMPAGPVAARESAVRVAALGD